jgi:hypothetical protein
VQLASFAAARLSDRKTARRKLLAAAVEALEHRQLLSVSQTSDGWTDITAPTDARIVYVSSSTGSDQNTGLSDTSPVRSLSYGISLLHAKAADQLLLARGDAWDESLGIWGRSGIDQDQPMVIGAYGAGARPLLRTSDYAFRVHSGGGVSHVALVGLHLQHTGSSGADGLSITGKAEDLLIEDCFIEQYQNNIVAEASFGTISNIRIRRSLIVDAHNYFLPTRRNSEGAFFEAVQTLVLEENVFDHNGWAVPSDATIYNHNVYIRSTCEDVVARGNVFARASSHGLQARSGGIIENNVFVDNPIGLSFGLVNSSPVTPGGVIGRVKDNAFIGGGSINGDDRGNGLEIGNTRPAGISDAVTIDNNLFTHGKLASANSAAIRISSGFSMTNTWDAVGINDLYVRNNKVYDWGVGLEILKGLHTGLDVATAKANHDWNLLHPNETPRDDKWPWSLSNLQVRKNDFQKIPGYLVQHDAPIDAIVPVTERPIQFSENRYYGTGPVPFTTLTELLSDVRVDLSRAEWVQRVEPTAIFGKVAYPDPERSIGSYNASLGGAATTDGFLAATRVQTRQNWNPALTAAALRDYLFTGFDMVSVKPIDPFVAPRGKPNIAPHVWASGHALKLSVTYSGGTGINPVTIDENDVVLTSDATSSPAHLTSVEVVDEGGGAFTATYTFDGPRGKWRKRDSGTFTFSLNPDQVQDTAGNSVVPDAAIPFELHVGHTPKPVIVKKVRLRTGHDGTQQLTIKFSADVHTVEATDIIITPQEAEPFDSAGFVVTYNSRSHVAIYTFPNLPGGQLGSGEFRVSLSASGNQDVWNRPLDGDRDRVSGGDWVWNISL